jgi:hypothetical protein
MNDDALTAWLDEYRQLSDELLKVCDRYRWKMDERGLWNVAPTQEEEWFDSLSYFYNAALINNGAVFSYVPFMIEYQPAFEAIGARGCLAALRTFAPIFSEQQFATKEDQDRYWREHQSDIEAVEELVDDANDFARLLLRYAEQNAGRIGARSK